MPAPEDIDEALEQAAITPQSATIDGNTIVSRSADDLIKLDKHEAAKEQMRSSGRLLFNKISPPGAT